jgi:hypothetical protein
MKMKLEQIIESLAAGTQAPPTGALYDRYELQVYATEYLIEGSCTLESDLLSRVQRLDTIYNEHGQPEYVRIRVLGAL